MSILTLTKDNFKKEVMEADKPVLIDFWAGWCGPCRMLSPVVDQLAEEISDVKICKVNVDEQPELAREFSVMSIPTLVYMKNGKIVNQTAGVKSKAAIADMISA